MIQRVQLPKAERYVRSIRNQQKREYARAYLDHIMALRQRERPDVMRFQPLSYMAAQAVRMHIDEIMT